MQSPRIEINPKVMMGKPVIKGTRITVEVLLKKMAKNLSIDEIIKEYPQLKRKDIQAALDYAAASMNNEEIHLLPEKQQ